MPALTDAPMPILPAPGSVAATAETVPARSTARPSGEAGTLRACRPEDLAAVARLFRRTFRAGRGPASDVVADYLRTILFEHPWQDPDITSKVSIGTDGAIDGFIGVLPVRMTFAGRPVVAAHATSLMVDSPETNPLVGARLLRAYLQGPQALSFSETSNPIAQRMWEKLGGRTIPSYSMEWFRFLRPFGSASALLAARIPATGWLQPLAPMIDRLLARPPKPLERTPARLVESTDEAEIARLMIRFAGRYRLAPAWDVDTVRFKLAHAAHKDRHGPLVRGVVRDGRGRELGCVLYCGRPGRIALALQVLGEPSHLGAVIDALLADAFARGCVAVRGRTQPDLLGALQLRGCLFLHRSSMTVHSDDPDILAVIGAGDALLTGVAGETWTRLIGSMT